MEKCMCYKGLQEGPLGTWGVRQVLLKKGVLGDPERWWRVGWDEDWFRGNAESAAVSPGRTSY